MSRVDDTDLPDLTSASLDDLALLPLEFADVKVRRQVEKPRTNLGASGPPGRED